MPFMNNAKKIGNTYPSWGIPDSSKDMRLNQKIYSIEVYLLNKNETKVTMET